MNPENIISNFKLRSKFTSAKPISTGHINDTFLIETEDQNEKYVLQKINHNIFKNVTGLINNILLATKHISKKIDQNPNEELLKGKLELIATTNQNYFYQDAAGNYWRLYNYIPGECYEMIDDPIKAYKAGKAFGKYQELLSDLPSGQLIETIPDFHNMKTRYRDFNTAVGKDAFSRAEAVKGEIAFIRAHIDEMIAMQDLIDAGKIPVRITHNDTKINNILFDKNGIPLCIIDLDTVMPGSVLYDFGDAIRTAANTVTEEELDLTQVSLDMKIFDAYTKGYLETTRPFLVKEEIENLALAAKYITFIMGLRFLTGYLEGDNYHKSHYPGQNAHRARVQFKLVESMDAKYSEMKKIISGYAS